MDRCWENLYNQLSAVETLNVVDKKLPSLNAKGERLLRYLRLRRSREG